MAFFVSLAWLALGATVPLSGTVVDAAGRPVAGATVWLGDTNATHLGPEVMATAETDVSGHFRLERADDLMGRGGTWSPTLWAYKPGARLAFLEFKRAFPAADDLVPLALGPATSTALRVLGPDGEPASGARVRVTMTKLKAPRPPDKLLDRIAATTDDDGRATIDGIAPADVLAVDVTARGQVVQGLTFEPDTGTVALRPVGRLKVRVVVVDDPKALGGWRIKVTSRPAGPGYRGVFTSHWVSETTGDDGRVEFPQVAEGLVTWSIVPPEGSQYVVASQPAASIRGGETRDVEIPLRRGTWVEGTVREAPGGAPIAGVKVDLMPLRAGPTTVEPIVTDARGRFSTVVLPGPYRFRYSPFALPREYFVPPGTQSWTDFVVQDEEVRHECPPLPLRKAAQVVGRVVDEAGEPAAAVDVTGLWTSAEYPNSGVHVLTHTDARGEFALGSIAPGAQVEISATAGWVVKSEPATVARAGDGGPITLRLRKQPALSLSGRVLGTDGQPLAGALVRVNGRPAKPQNPTGNISFAGPEEVRTGPDGRYLTPEDLPTGYDFRVEAELPGYEPSASPWIVAPGAPVPDVRLRRGVALRAVAGRVVDSAGKPVAGAGVFQSGDGPVRTRGTTNGDGGFRVVGVRDAPALLFVSKEGYHVLGRRIEAGDRPVELALRRLDEPPSPPLRPAAPAISRDEERAIVRELVAAARKEAPDPSFGSSARQGVTAITALVDPDKVIEMIESQVISSDPPVLTELAVSRSEGDPRKAFGLLDDIAAPSVAATVALGLFDRLGTTAPADSRRGLLELAERRARAIDQPDLAASQLARIADRRLDLGDAARGAELVREARVLAEKPHERIAADPRDDLVFALARVDLAESLRLLEGRKLPPFQADRLRAGIALRIAATDVDGTRRVLGLITDQARASARRAACLRMATTDLAAARALAAETPDPLLEALLPAAAARSRAGSDAGAARALLRESVERLRGLGEGSALRPTPAVALARLLPLVARIDPDRAPDVLWLALSLRPPLPIVFELRIVYTELRRQYIELAELAALTARYDRAAAEVVFAPVAARVGAFYDESRGLGNEVPALFRAAGACDALAARALLDSLPEDPPPPANPGMSFAGFRHQSKALARTTLARTLALSPALRFRELVQPPPFGEDWLRDFDD